MNDDKRGLAHNMIVENRNRLEMAGVTDIDSFTENTVVAYTDFGEVCVTGNNLHVDKLSIETGQLYLTGQIDSITYYDGAPREKGLFGRLFK
ncbi:MAG: YabP/YqfC family sporulation protein [Oscillospiraceae bacterium]|jgi:sporulation protein YabP|nr:YabP/YqfC family sporulation protein [Oscillospiraceae bacterium]